MGGLATPLCASLEGDQLIDLPLRDGLHLAATVLSQPAVNVLARGDAVKLFSPEPALTRHQGSYGGAVGEQNLRTVSQADVGAADGDLLELHGVESLATPIRYQRTQQPAKGVLCQCWNWFFLAHRVAVGQMVW